MEEFDAATVNPIPINGRIRQVCRPNPPNTLIYKFILYFYTIYLIQDLNIHPLYTTLLKPAADRIFSFLILLLTSPLLLVVMVWLYFANGGKVWFKQERPGKEGKIFTVIKFKTMSDEKDAHGQLLPDDRRLTAIGKFIRNSSLDELPQLFNVLRGEMSFVGPRPLLVEYLALYSPEQQRRHLVKPGITGWAQVNGRNTVSWPRKFAFDVWYVDHISFVLDIKILLLTVMKVFKAEGISSNTSVTMEKFHGNN